MNLLSRSGQTVVERWKAAALLAGVIAAALRLSAQKRRWTPPVRNVLARQVFFTGVEAARFIAWVGCFVGVAVVMQAQLWLAKFGQSALVGPLLVAVVVREMGPLLTNFVVIGRSGTAIASELASMRANGEIRVLEVQGLDPFAYLVVPRVLGMAISVFCLTVVLVVVSFASGFLSGRLLGVQATPLPQFVDSMMQAIAPADVLNFLTKTLAPGLISGAICCVEGLSIAGAASDVPRAAGQAVIRSVAALFAVSAVVSVLTYL